MICDDETDQSINAQTFALLHQIARLRLAQRRLTVIDATNLHFRARRPLLRMARRNHIPAVAIVFDVSLATCLTHNLALMQRMVPPEVLQLHASQLTEARSRLERESYELIYWLDESKMRDAQVEKFDRHASANTGKN